jgi:hypothetical protein
LSLSFFPSLLQSHRTAVTVYAVVLVHCRALSSCVITMARYSVERLCYWKVGDTAKPWTRTIVCIILYNCPSSIQPPILSFIHPYLSGSLSSRFSILLFLSLLFLLFSSFYQSTFCFFFIFLSFVYILCYFLLYFLIFTLF